jgi:hypothetical protein
MTEAFQEYRAGELVNAMAIAGSISAPDWRLACVDWLNRRWQKKLAARGVDHAA